MEVEITVNEEGAAKVGQDNTLRYVNTTHKAKHLYKMTVTFLWGVWTRSQLLADRVVILSVFITGS